MKIHRRSFFAALTAPILARFAPKPERRLGESILHWQYRTGTMRRWTFTDLDYLDYDCAVGTCYWSNPELAMQPMRGDTITIASIAIVNPDGSSKLVPINSK